MSERSKVAVVGSRDFPNLEAVRSLVRKFRPENVLVISGGAIGVDGAAAETAKAHGIPCLEILPDYRKHHPKLAPKIRNREIAQECDVMVAFWDGNSGGTANAIAWATFYDKDVVVLMPESAAPKDGVTKTAEDWPDLFGGQLVSSVATAEKVNGALEPPAPIEDAIHESEIPY